MEDRSTVIQDLGLSELEGSLLWPQTFAGVYDGHGGGQASEYLWSNLHLKVSNYQVRATEISVSTKGNGKVPLLLRECVRVLAGIEGRG